MHIDGVAVPDAPYLRTYDAFGDAQAAPPLAIEVWRGGALVDARDLRPDACKVVCQTEDGACPLGELDSSTLTLSVDPDGTLSPLAGGCTDGDTTFPFTY